MRNKVILIGNVGKDAELKNEVCFLSLATSSSYKKDDQWVEDTEWHRIVAFGKTAERLSKVKKGERLYVEGKIKYRQWDKEDGTKGYATEIHAYDILSLTKKEKEDTSDSPSADVGASVEDDDLPF